ncbi:hypothetical protein PanWU01x14_053880 [Parasponia andersonii]|uniref:Uncharacterized protein n=1 Tax=Parasponia andersonii TaxID=3476 RepID=A0A2P5DKP3_PARAD|nr:hypothetical protein PanWU01x14_053880 [Parasponia andersonii]
MTLYLEDRYLVVYQVGLNSIKPNPLLRACVGGRKKQECYGSLFTIHSEIGTIDQYPWVLVVSDFSDIFLEDFPGLPPDREIEFCIDLVSGAQLVSIPIIESIL